MIHGDMNQPKNQVKEEEESVTWTTDGNMMGYFLGYQPGCLRVGQGRGYELWYESGGRGNCDSVNYDSMEYHGNMGILINTPINQSTKEGEETMTW